MASNKQKRNQVWVPKNKTPESKPESPSELQEPFGFLNHPCLESMSETKLTEWKPNVLTSIAAAKTKIDTIVQRLNTTTQSMEKINIFQPAALKQSPENVILLIGFYVGFHELHKKIDDLVECTKEATSFDFP